ncbi:MAG: ABC transporter substrate-binding protein [Armatimonadetes bacterium]|nr:ABC transporter substrate-binding protein [Armatimonadota bacterium]
MRRGWWLALTLVLAATVPAVGAFPVTVTDALGRKVTLVREPARIISIAPSVTEVLFALGLDRRIVGVSDADDYPRERVRTKPRVGGVQLNIERIVSLRPDLIIGMPGLQAAQLERLIAMGLPVLAVEANSIPQTYAQIALVGAATASDRAAQRLIASMRSQQSGVEAAVRGRPRLRVYVEIWGEPLITAGQGTFIDDLVRRAGGRNVFADLRGWPQLSAEAVIQRNPEIIVLTHRQRDQVLARRGWAQVDAIRSGRVVSADSALLSRPGPRIVDGLAYLARLLHPEAFRR